MVRLGQRLRRLGVDAGNGYRQQVVLTVAQGAECPWPVYEMAFMLDTWLRRHRLRGLVGIALATHEDVHLAQFGPAMHERVVRELEERSIDAYLGGFIHRVRHDRVVLRSRRRLPFDLLIAMPPHVASTKYESLPSNERHFLRVDAATCAVREHPDVFAVGDCNELPLKQAVMAVAQASVVADNIVARARGKPYDASFEPNSLCIMEELCTATYVQAPMAFADDARRTVGLRDDARFPYRVGSGHFWRAANRAIGFWVPSRLRHLQPIRLGAVPSRGTDGMLRAAAMFSKPVAAERSIVEDPHARAA
jgi:sulfide:quinone oxidoreductase